MKMMEGMARVLVVLTVVAYASVGAGYAAQPGASFYDDFDDGNAGNWTVCAGDWGVDSAVSSTITTVRVAITDRALAATAGTYHQRDASLVTKVSHVSKYIFDDFDATLEGRVLSSPTRERELGIMFRGKDLQNFYHFRWYSGYSERDDHLELWKYVNGQAILLKQIPVDHIPTGTKMVFKLSARGNQFTGQVLAEGKGASSTKRLSVTDPTYTTGLFGLTTYATEGSFDNVRITQ